MKRFSASALALLLLSSTASFAGAGAADLLSESTLSVHGLTRAWAVQMDMDGARSRLRDLVLDRGAVFAQTDRGLVQAFDAETGRPLWASAKQVGHPNRPTVPMGANDKVLAVVSGNRLYVLNRFNGETLLEKAIDEGAPNAGLAVSDHRVYVPMTTGLIVAYRIKPQVDLAKEAAKKKEEAGRTPAPKSDDDFRLSQEYVPPLACQSLGRSFVVPVLLPLSDDEERLAWPTDRGMLCVGRINRATEASFTVKFRLETRGEIAVPAVYLPPAPNATEAGLVIAGSCDGYAYAVNDRTGLSAWQFPLGQPVVHPMALIEGSLYVPTQLGGMYCLDARTGRQAWWTPQVAEFLAAGKERVYAVDKLGQLQTIDRKSGRVLGVMPLGDMPVRECNQQTDRIYLASATGLIQCLREPQQARPLSWIVEPVKKVEKVEKAEKKPVKPKPDGEEVEKKPAVEKKPPPEKKPVEKKPPPEKKPPRAKKGAAAAAEAKQ